MKTLLLNPSMGSGWIPKVYVPIGLCYLKACLIEEGLEDVKIVDMGDSKVDSIREIIQAESPEIVGITTFTDTRINALKAVAIAKEINPQVKTILGGVHATVMYQQIMENYPIVDIICRGESERTIVELLQALNSGDALHQVNGIVYRQEGKVVVNEEREKIKELDNLPFPNYDDFDLREYKDVSGAWKGKPVACIITSRGCPFSCSYCSSHSVWGNWRCRSIDNVLDEIEWLVTEYGYEVFTIFDDIFTINKARIKELCQGILNHGINIEWRAQTRADCVSLEILELMKEAGCQSLVFGVESGSPTILKTLNKNENIEDVVNAIAWCKKVGIRNQFNVIIGAPEETVTTIEETRNLIKRTKPDYMVTSNLRVYPGTELWKQAQDEGLSDEKFFLTDQECLYYTGAMSIPEMFQATRDYILLQARLQGLKGYLALAKFGFESLRRTPKKVALGILPWNRRSKVEKS